MGRHSTIPTLFDECKTVSIAFLKKHGYLDGATIKRGVLSWTRGGHPSGNIGISVDLTIMPTLILDYTCNGEPFNYKVNLIALNSNLGKGKVWYFVCPDTQLLCRKLYQGNRYFLHRKAFKGCYYENQVQSHRNRELWKVYSMHFIAESVYEQMYSKHFKSTYKGAPTKRMVALQKKLHLYDKVKDSLPSMEMLLLG